jgi:hypothetical protein
MISRARPLRIMSVALFSIPAYYFHSAYLRARPAMPYRLMYSQMRLCGSLDSALYSRWPEHHIPTERGKVDASLVYWQYTRNTLVI